MILIVQSRTLLGLSQRSPINSTVFRHASTKDRILTLPPDSVKRRALPSVTSRRGSSIRHDRNLPLLRANPMQLYVPLLGFTQRYAERIVGSIECPDRVVITGTLPFREIEPCDRSPSFLWLSQRYLGECDTPQRQAARWQSPIRLRFSAVPAAFRPLLSPAVVRGRKTMSSACPRRHGGHLVGARQVCF